MRNATGIAVAASALLVLVAGTAAAPASAKIVVGTSIKGVELGMTKKQVVAQVGKPKKVDKFTTEFGRVKILSYGKKLTVNITAGAVTLMRTRSPRQVTSQGVGVGSSKKQVKQFVPGVVCDNVSGFRSCHVNDFLPGEIVTVFRLKQKVVKSVEIGRVLD
jgi:hypothetical protein